jgi:hypothetical protein
MTQLSDILQSLPNLTQDEILQVRNRATMLLDYGPAAKANTNGHADEQFVLEAIVSVLSKMGVEHSSITVLKRQMDYKAFADKVPNLIKYLNMASTNRIEQRAILHASIELLYRNLIQIGLPISGRTLMSHIHRVPAVVNQAFPAYAECGMLSWIIRREISP